MVVEKDLASAQPCERNFEIPKPNTRQTYISFSIRSSLKRFYFCSHRLIVYHGTVLAQLRKVAILQTLHPALDWYYLFKTYIGAYRPAY